MLIPRKDGTLVYYPVERALTINPQVSTSECTLPNGAKVVMEWHYGEKILVRDQAALEAALKAEGWLPHAITEA